MSSVPPGDGADPSAPSMLDLVRLSPRDMFPPGGEDLYRQIALLADLSAGDEVLVAACGNGVTLEYFVNEYDAHGSGIDQAEHLVRDAEARAREEGLSSVMQFQHAPLDSLPYRDAIFDVSIGELGLTATADPAEAIRELVRVTRPGGAVILVQLVWKAQVDEERRKALSRHLGTRPLMLVEWKRLLREAGVEQLHTEDWSDERTAFRSRRVKPFPDFAELFSFPEKLGILRRAWRRWGWSGVKTALGREREVHRLLTRERILGLDLVKGVKKAPPPPPETEAADAADEAGGGPSGAPQSSGTDAVAEAVAEPSSADMAERPESDTAGQEGAGDAGPLPDDATKPPEDAAQPREDATQPPEDATQPRDDAAQPPEDAPQSPEDPTQPPEDATQPPGTVKPPDAAEPPGDDAEQEVEGLPLFTPRDDTP